MATPHRSVHGWVVAVTGGARGIGRATAAALLAEGARVAIGDLDGELCARVAAELGDGAIGLTLDVTSEASFRAFLDGVEAALGPLDVLVNNAGIAPVGAFADEPAAVTARVFAVNLGGVALGTKLALERLLPRAAGHVVNVASGLGRTPAPGVVSYCASKFAIAGLTDALRLELEDRGVELHLILPSLVATDMAAGAGRLRGVPTQTPQAVAAAVVRALQTGRYETYVPRALGWLVRLRPVLPARAVRRVERLLGSDRLFTRIDALERAAYVARIAPPADAAAPGYPASSGSGAGTPDSE